MRKSAFWALFLLFPKNFQLKKTMLRRTFQIVFGIEHLGNVVFLISY